MPTLLAAIFYKKGERKRTKKREVMDKESEYQDAINLGYNQQAHQLLPFFKPAQTSIQGLCDIILPHVLHICVSYHNEGYKGMADGTRVLLYHYQPRHCSLLRT